MFNFIKNSLHKIYTHITTQFGSLFNRSVVDATTLKELELILLQADTGAHTTKSIIAALKKQLHEGTIQAGSDLKQALYHALVTILKQPPIVNNPQVILLVGINGSGKTTCAAKIAYHAKQHNKRVLLVAADSFRAAAVEQLHHWATDINVDILLGKSGQDPASIVFAGSQKFKNEQYDLLIVDTAGRLQTKVNLMHELRKIRRVITKQLPEAQVATLLTIDAMLGQNSFEQAQLFKESTDLSAIILTKMDGTAKGGIVFSIADQLHIPIGYMSFGENVKEYAPFNPEEYVADLLEL